MCFVDVLLQSFVGAEDVCAVVTSVPVTFLLVLQAELAGVAGPSGEAPVTFDFVRMRGAVVEMLPESLCCEGPATAFVHCGRWADGRESWRRLRQGTSYVRGRLLETVLKNKSVQTWSKR